MDQAQQIDVLPGTCLWQQFLIRDCLSHIDFFRFSLVGGGLEVVYIPNVFCPKTRWTAPVQKRLNRLDEHCAVNSTNDLDRFVQAQFHVYAEVLRELRHGKKRSHWMWFIFPQHKALGRSEMAHKYGIESLEEARAYWQHAVLGPRLAECCDALLSVCNRSVHDIFGSPDDLKLCSCMTLFTHAVTNEARFSLLLEKYFFGIEDAKTLALIQPD